MFEVCYLSEGSAVVALVARVAVHATSAYGCVVSWDWVEVLPIIPKSPPHRQKLYPFGKGSCYSMAPIHPWKMKNEERIMKNEELRGVQLFYFLSFGHPEFRCFDRFYKVFDMAGCHVRFIYKRNAFLIILEASKRCFTKGF